MPDKRSKYTPGTWMWCEEDGREECTIGALTVYLSPSDQRLWNDADFRDPLVIRCSLSTHQPDHSYERDGEVLVHPGLPADWYGTIGSAIEKRLLPKNFCDQLNDCEALKI